MADNNCETTKTCEPKSENTDWKAEFTPHVRRKYLQRVLDSLKKEVFSSNPDILYRTVRASQHLEERAFYDATSKDDYIYTITGRIMNSIQKISHRVVTASSNSDLTQTSKVVGVDQNSRLQNVCQVSCDLAVSPVRQGMQPDISANSCREIPGVQSSHKSVYQQHQQQELQHQLSKRKVQQSNICASPIQHDILSNDHHQQQQHSLSQPSQLQCSQFLTVLTESQKSLSMEKSNTTVCQLNQLLGQENTVEQQPLSCQKQMPNSMQHPVNLLSNVLDSQNPLRMLRSPLDVMNLRSHQHSELSLEQVGDTSSKQKIQRTGQPLTCHQLLVSQKQSKQEATHQRLQSLPVSIQPENVISKQKQQLSQGTSAEVSSVKIESSAPSERENKAECHDQAYQKLQSMKEEYLPQLKDICKMLNVMRQKAPGLEMAENYNKKMIAVEKLIRFLFLRHDNIARIPNTVFEYYQDKVLQFVKLFQQQKLASVQKHAQIHQPPDGQSQVSQLQQLGSTKVQFSSAKSTLTSTPGDSSPLSSMQQGILSSQPQMTSLLHSNLQTGQEQRNIPSSLQHTARSEGQNVVGAQQEKLFCNTSVNGFDSDINSPQKSSTVNPFQQQKQQVKHQMMQPQNLKRHIQPQLIQQKMQQMAMPDVQLPDTSGMRHQQPLISQLSEHHPQMPLPVAPCQVRSTSPKISQHSSAQADQKTLPSPLSIGGGILHSPHSPLIKVSPSSPSSSLTRFSIPANNGTLTSSASPLATPQYFGHPQTTVALTKVDMQNGIVNQSVSADLSGVSTSCFHIKSTNQDGNQQSSSTKQPLQRLLDAVESLSHESLSASVSEIGSVVNFTDMLAGTACKDSRAAVGEDLTTVPRCHLQAGKFRLQSKGSLAMNVSSSSLCKTNDLNQSTGQICDLLESTATYMIKRRRIEPRKALMDEIRYTNQLMVETMVDLDPTEDTATYEAGEGTAVRCTYRAVAFSGNLKMQYDSKMLPVLPLRLLVPADYPNSSPIILDGLNVDWSTVSEELADLMAKTRLRFNRSLRQLSEPMSLAEMAKSWDICAREVYREFAKQLGGECFSSSSLKCFSGMNNNNCETAKACEPKSENTDWRAELTPHVRRKYLQRILDLLKKEVSSSNPNTSNLVVRVSQHLEERAFRDATSKEGYIHTITEKVLMSIQKLSDRIFAANSSNSGNSVSCDLAGSPVRQGMQPDISASSCREIPGVQSSQKAVYQQHQQQELQHQLSRRKVHQSNICASSIQQDILNNDLHQQHEHSLSYPSQLQCSQRLTELTESQKSQSLEQLNATVYQLNQLLSQEITVEQQQLSCQKNMPISMQQPVNLQSNVLDMQQPLRMIRSPSNSNVMNLRSHQQSELSLEQVRDTSSKQKDRWTGKPLPYHQLPASQKQSKQEATHQILQSLPVSIQPENVINQQKLQLSQGTNAEVSSVKIESSAPSEPENNIEFHDQAYQLLQSMKEEYLPQLKDICKMLNVMHQKASGTEMAETYNQQMTAVEKLIRFLFLRHNDIAHLPKKVFEYYRNKIRNSVELFKQQNSASVQKHAQLRPPPDGQSQVSQLQQLGRRKVQFSSAKSTLTSTPGDSSPLSAMQQGILSSQPQMTRLLHSDLQTGQEQRNIPSALQHAARSEGQNIVGAQQAKLFCNTSVNGFDSYIHSPQKSSTVNPVQQHKQQVKQQKKQPQNLKRNIQPQLIQQKMQQMAVPNIKLPETSGMLHQQPLMSQLSEHHPQIPLPVAPCQVRYTSPKLSHHSSAQVDQKTLPPPLSRGGGTLRPPLIKASPSSSLTRFSIPADHGTLTSSASPLAVPQNLGHPQTTVALTKVDMQNGIVNQSVAAASSGVSTSCFHIKSTNPDGNQQSSSTKQPLQRLLDAVEALSPKSLSASVSEIGSVVNLTDMLAGRACKDSRAAVGEDLTSGKFRLQNRRSLDMNVSSSSPCKTNDLNQSTGQICDLLESTATYMIKRRRIEPRKALMDEIRYTNQLMVETMVDLDPTEDTATYEAGEGTAVRCTYRAVAFSGNLKMQYDSKMLPVLPLRLLVPADYPNSSPIILDGLNVDWSSVTEESADLMAKTRLRFNRSLRQLSEPMSLAEMAESWDVCARDVYREFAKQLGGECFSSRYGTWENYVIA
ncbi:hypothetical protein Ddye_011887 [Dipteronia dyeriana]|uniref:Mediator complex subunit 15 KIX domain-containing protein n=1 Tax=Dipteronia dyeriana TaxID=168575 RepID=A0AAE0CHS2_9ROSI|nr:hypothetical protein Ddye_011887 [Dipteronia dyeriana]